MEDGGGHIVETARSLRGAAAGLVFARDQFAVFYDSWLAERPGASAPACFLHALIDAYQAASKHLDGLNLADDGDALALALARLGPAQDIVLLLGAAVGGGLFSLAEPVSPSAERRIILNRFLSALGETRARAELQSGEFQALTSFQAIWTDPGRLVPALILARRRLCAIFTVNDDGRKDRQGTGFLIGPSTVLTNWHVVSNRDVPLEDVNQIEVRFDYSATTGLRGAEQSKRYPVEEWLIAHSESGTVAPPDAEDCWWKAKKARNLWRESVQDKLDYAVIRLASSPGLQRGWYDLSRLAEPDSEDENYGCWVMHHPSKGDQTVTEGELEFTDREDTRLFHSASTVNGSSGGLVLNAFGQPIGLHYLGLAHSGWTEAEARSYSGLRVPDEAVNCAISLKSIAQDLQRKGALADIGASRGLAPYRGCLDGVRPVFGRKGFFQLLPELYSGQKPIMRVHVEPSVSAVLKPGKSFTIEMIKALFRPPEHCHIVFRAGEVQVDALGQTRATLLALTPEAAETLPQTPATTSSAFVAQLVNHLGAVIRDRLGNKTVWLMIDDLDRHDLSDASGREFLATLYNQIATTSNLRIVLIGLPESVDIGGLDPGKVVMTSIGHSDLEDRRALFSEWLNERGARDTGLDDAAAELLSRTVEAYAGQTAPLRRMSAFASKFMLGALNEVFGEAAGPDVGEADE